MGSLDIYKTPDLDIEEVAALYLLTVTYVGENYVTVEGEDEDLDQFAQFIAQQNLY